MSEPDAERGVSDPPADARREAATWRERHAREVARREELLTVLSHELRTPVTVIAGFGRLLLSGEAGPVSDRQRRFLEEILRSCQRLDEFVVRTLEDARAGSGEARLWPRDASLAGTVEGVVSFLKPLLDERRLQVVLDLSADAEQARFDPPRIEQVLTNLLGNAVRHAPPGSAISVTSRACGAGARRFVEVSVSDCGPGVPHAERERIFEPGVGGSNGLGVGLAICRRLIDAHGGAIDVGDAPGGGARFIFTLPVAGAPEGRSS
jgi:signal transduction histidine kinase